MKHLLIRFLLILIAALLAGTSFGLWMGIKPEQYSQSAYLELQRNLVQSLNTLMISLVILAFILSLLDGYFSRKQKINAICLFISAAFFLACILISRFGNTPIQLQVFEWKAETLPDNWTHLRDQWWLLHKLRTLCELIALVLISWITVFKSN